MSTWKTRQHCSQISFGKIRICAVVLENVCSCYTVFCIWLAQIQEMWSMFTEPMLRSFNENDEESPNEHVFEERSIYMRKTALNIRQQIIRSVSPHHGC